MTTPLEFDSLEDTFKNYTRGSRAGYYNLVARGEWVGPFKMNGRSYVLHEENLTLQCAIVAGATSAQMRELVKMLHGKRAALMPVLEEPAPVQSQLFPEPTTDSP
jgi:hypothetical protein